MIARRRSPGRPRPERPVAGGDRIAVLLEEMRGQNQIVIEAVVGVGERLDRHVVETARRFDTVDRRFDAVDTRFDAIDRRFEAVDTRFDAIDRPFETVDTRFDAVDARFDAVDARFGAERKRKKPHFNGAHGARAGPGWDRTPGAGGASRR
jgi:hypothetical protein